MNHSKGNYYVLFLGVTAGLGGLLFGFDVAIITGAGPFLAKQFQLGDIGLGWAFSSLLFGCILGTILAGRLTDRLGRRKPLLWVAALFGVTCVATALAQNFASFLVYRFIAGVAVGGVSLLSPLYVAEVSPAPIRGRMGALYQLSIMLGINVSYVLNYFLRNVGVNNWRWMFVMGTIPSIAFLALVSKAPETPRFSYMKGRFKEARETLDRIGGEISSERVLAQIATSMPASGRSIDFLRPSVRRAMMVSIGLALLVHLSGVNTVIDYAPAIFQSAGWNIDGALGSTVIVGITELVFTVVSLALIDRYGRRALYMYGSAGMGVALLALVLANILGIFHGTVVLVFILVYLAFFSACVGPVFWTLVPEMFPDDVRGTAMIVPVLVQWAANALVVLVFPYSFHVIGKTVTLAFLACMSLAQGLFTFINVPETKNRALEEIEAFWNR